MHILCHVLYVLLFFRSRTSSEESDSSEERYHIRRDSHRDDRSRREDYSPPPHHHHHHSSSRKSDRYRHGRDYYSRRHYDDGYGGGRRERSFREDRSYYNDDRRSESGRHRGRNDHDRSGYGYKEGGGGGAAAGGGGGSSRPSSRAGSIYEERYVDRDRYERELRYERDRYDYVMYHAGYHSLPPYAVHPSYPQSVAAPPPPADPTVLANFEKHWQHYLRHPEQFEALQATNPMQYANLNNYYRMYGEMLRLPTIPPAASASASVKQEPLDASSSLLDPGAVRNEDRAPSRASVHSGQSSGAVGVAPVQPPVVDGRRPESRLEGEVSTIHPDPSAEPRYQPTFVQEAHGDPGAEEKSDALARMTPAKFPSAHVSANFGPLGRLVKADAHAPSLGQSATVELHSMQAILERRSAELTSFPGPLVPGRTHKAEVIQFCQSKVQAAAAGEVDGLVDRDSYVLVWELLILLLRQKNTVDGSDIAELLLKGRHVETPYVANGVTAAFSASDEANSSGVVVAQERTAINVSATIDQERYDGSCMRGVWPPLDALSCFRVTSKFRDYLLYGHKKEGLEYAMRHGLWGHALFLASKMDERAYSNVMLRFANGLVPNDPLQTLYQLMSGRQPVAVKECADRSWGDWRPHLAMILSNPSGKEMLDHR